MRRLSTSVVAAFLLSGCVGPMHVTSEPAYNNAVDKVISAIENEGYSFVDMKHDSRNELRHEIAHMEGDNYYSDWIPNEIVNINTYSFADTHGNTMSFSVQFKAGVNRQNSALYFTHLEVVGCSTTNNNDYERLCGGQSPVWSLDSIQKDMTVKP